MRTSYLIVLFTIAIVWLTNCTQPRKLSLPAPSNDRLSGSGFFSKVASAGWKERDSLAVNEILSGNIPSFLKKFTPIEVSATIDGMSIKARYFVLPDYLAVGNNEDWARVPLTPMAAQQVADSLHCFLPTRKMVNDIYQQAKVKLPPVPMFAYRDSSPTMYQHHLIIEGQRKQQKGLIAGIKKDVVLSGSLMHGAKADRVAIYGWHQLNGKPIQPLYSGHVNWYVDYSHGIRLVHETIWVNGKAINYREVLKDARLKTLLCDEEWCDMYRY